jgi:phosphoglycolate phosphatase-like HAD superfamily hydrolase
MQTLVEITNELAADFGYRPITPQQITDWQKLSSRQILKMSGISLWQIPFLMRRFRLAFRKKTNEVKLFPEIVPMLHSLKRSGYKIGIVSSNSVENISMVLQKHHVEHLFSFIDSSSVFGKGRAIRASLRANYIRREEAIYVGDEIRDIDAARKGQIPSIAVTWGFNHADTLGRHQPDYLVNKPQEILQLLAV